MKTVASDLFENQPEISQGSLGVVENSEHKSVPEKAGKNTRKFPFLAGAFILIALAVIGAEVRSSRIQAVRQRSQPAAEMTVTVVHPQKASIIIPVLPGQTEAYTDAPIFAQTSGYLKKWYFDIGTKVKAGAVLAEIDTSEVDQILVQAKAILAQAKTQLEMAQAARDLAEVTDKRHQNLFKGKVISAQDFDTAADIYGGNQAVVTAEQANVDRLEALEAFKIIRAPFDGTVTARNTDIGAYVPAGSGTPLFRMAATSRLRVYVTVSQALSSLIRVGEQAELTVDQFPGRKFLARVVGTDQAISPSAKRLLTELEVPNKTGQLFSGAYVQVTLKIEGKKGDLTIPAGTLLFRSGKPAVGVVRANGTVEIRKIVINRDLGSTLEISQGLSESDQIITSPPPGLVDGTDVTIAKPI
jgi:membrane fusion protein (multidrug efflux system)